ncbi:hypothetical protein QR97_29775 [Streptomyces sp. PBH53]|uniref:hypothetical protein n=1 Tax=Streptomyces sp. PBH53 TaxID=1577075 RepID=UPI000655F1DA|nr:hypothetical protein QR97_29775 [Streptomyces sp. PBH53]
MADLITVEDPDDPRLADYTGLTDVELRRKREPAEGLFIAEGEKVIRRAKEAGYEMRSMLLSAKWIDVMRDVIDELPAPVYAVSPELATSGTAEVLKRNGIHATVVRKQSEGTGPNGEKTIVQLIHDGEVDLIVNTPYGTGGRLDGYDIRTAAVARSVPCLTTVQALAAAVQGIDALHHGDVGVRSLQEHAAHLTAARD